MRNSFYYALAGLCLAALTAPAFASSPWNGTWKLDEAKSQMAGGTFTYSMQPSGTYRFSDGSNLQFTFACDGKDYPVVADYSATCTKAGDQTYVFTSLKNGKLVSTSTQVISSDGKTMTDTTKGTRPDGTPFTDIEVDRRISGTTGLAGEWKSAKSSSSAPSVMKISVSANAMTLEFPGYKSTVTAKLDGTDAPATGPQVPPGVTMSLKSQGTNEVTSASKLNGKVYSYDLYTLSADGKTITDVSWLPGKPNEKQTYVYEKQ